MALLEGYYDSPAAATKGEFFALVWSNTYGYLLDAETPHPLWHTTNLFSRGALALQNSTYFGSARVMTEYDVVVVGSANYDMFAYVDKFPTRGETKVGNAFETGFGGKGANQAVCARILGARTAFVGKVGKDHFGSLTRENFESHGVDVSHLSVAPPGVPTGVANIIVEESGENSMVLVLGANQAITSQDVEGAAKCIQNSRVLLCQNEIPLERTIAALRLARSASVTTIFNAAPAVDLTLPCSSELFSLVDIWIVNQSELEAVAGSNAQSNEERCKLHLKNAGCLAVIATLGARGALLCDQTGVIEIPACVVDKVVDTTGAGDAFTASFAVAYAKTRQLKESCSVASRLSAETVKTRGCQASYSTLKDLAIL